MAHHYEEDYGRYARGAEERRLANKPPPEGVATPGHWGVSTHHDKEQGTDDIRDVWVPDEPGSCAK